MNRRDYSGEDQQFGAPSRQGESARQGRSFRPSPPGSQQYGQYAGRSPEGQYGDYSRDQRCRDQPRRAFGSEDEEEFGTTEARSRRGGIEETPDPRMESWAGGPGLGYVEDWRTVTGQGDWHRQDFRRPQYGVSDWGRQGDWGRRSRWAGSRGYGQYPAGDSGAFRGDSDYVFGPNFGSGYGERGHYSWEHDLPGERSHPTWREKIFGRGPKNYTRSDERIREEIHERLHAHPYVDSREVSVNVKDGKVTLSGTVANRQDKHEIENVVDGVFGVKDIDNSVRVVRSQDVGGQFP